MRHTKYGVQTLYVLIFPFYCKYDVKLLSFINVNPLVQALAEWRALRREQDEEYEHSLSIDRARVNMIKYIFSWYNTYL